MEKHTKYLVKVALRRLKEFNKDLLGQLPLNQDLRVSSDKGEPLTYSNPEHEVSKIFKDIALKVKQSFQ